MLPAHSMCDMFISIQCPFNSFWNEWKKILIFITFETEELTLSPDIFVAKYWAALW